MSSAHTKKTINTKTPSGSIYELTVYNRYTGEQFSIEYVRASSLKAAVAKLELRIESGIDYYPIFYRIEA